MKFLTKLHVRTFDKNPLQRRLQNITLVTLTGIGDNLYLLYHNLCPTIELSKNSRGIFKISLLNIDVTINFKKGMRQRKLEKREGHRKV